MTQVDDPAEEAFDTWWVPASRQWVKQPEDFQLGVLCFKAGYHARDAEVEKLQKRLNYARQVLVILCT